MKLEMAVIATTPFYATGMIMAEDVRNPFSNEVMVKKGEVLHGGWVAKLEMECIDTVYVHKLLADGALI